MTNSEQRIPREEQARREVGQTDVMPGVARGLVVCFLLLVAALPAIEWSGLRASDQPGPWALLVRETGGEMPAAVPDGSWARLLRVNRAALTRIAAFETALEEQSPVGQRLRPPVQAVLSGWLGAGNERVYIGRDGWLFFRPDVEALTGRGFLDPAQLARRVAAAREIEVAPVPDPRPAIHRFAADLAARGITLILMPTPVKPSVHPGALASRSDGPRAPIQNASYESFIEELREDGLVVFDPARSLAAVVEREASALAAVIRAYVDLAAVPAPGYTTQPREARHTGDTALMLDLPGGQSLYPPETVALRFVAGPDGDPWRPSRGADVLVLGDSFSTIYSLPGMGWGQASGFVEHLSLALDRPVDRLVRNDQGARATRDLLARELRLDPGRLAATRVIVWQFATRELSFGDWAVVPLP